eukprot:6325895-Heterocapsa_arctica.AAC.1
MLHNIILCIVPILTDDLRRVYNDDVNSTSKQLLGQLACVYYVTLGCSCGDATLEPQRREALGVARG